MFEQYAMRFVKAGFAALSFDYRHFGESEGEPRQLYSVNKQLDDNIVAPGSNIKIKKILGNKATFLKYPIGHFEIYFGKNFKRNINEI